MLIDDQSEDANAEASLSDVEGRPAAEPAADAPTVGQSPAGQSAVVGASASEAEAPWWRRIAWVTVLGWIAPPLAYLAAALYSYSDFVQHPSHGVVGGPDGILFSWYFQAIEHNLAHGHSPFLSTAMNAPTGVSTMWNTSLMLLAVLLAPLTAVVGGLAVAGWLMVFAPAFAASSAYIVLRRLSGRAVGAALAATLYGFGPFFVGQAGHLHLTAASVTLPWILWFGYRLLLRQDGRPVRVGLALGAVVAAAVLMSEEVVVLATVAAGSAIVAGAVAQPRAVRSRVRFALQGGAWAAGLAVAVLAIPLYSQFEGPLALKAGVQVAVMPQDVAGLVKPGILQYYASPADVAANAKFQSNAVENTGYLGWPLIALVLGVVIWRLVVKDRFALWWSITAGAVVIFSLGTRVFVNGRATIIRTPWYVLKQLPLFPGVVVVRFSVIVTLLIALLLSYALARLPNRITYGVGLLVVLACLVPLRPARGGTYSEISQISTPKFFTSSLVDQIDPGSNVLVLPQVSDPFVAQYPMYWQIKAKMRFNILGGYSVFDEDGQSSYFGHLSPLPVVLSRVAKDGVAPPPDQVERALAALKADNVRYIVITDRVQNRDVVTAAAERIAGCQARDVGGVTLCAIPQ